MNKNWDFQFLFYFKGGVINDYNSVSCSNGIICFFVGLEENILDAIIICLMSALSAGGVSDLIKTKKTVNIDEIT